MFELLIKGGTLVDGTGKAPRVADVAIEGGQIVAVSSTIDALAAEVVHAEGLLVTPGFVDIHTHFDGQVTWDDRLLPASGHGVTTVVMGNCGVGFAPVRPGGEARLISLMEGVEDIPGTALHEGIKWSWESFPEYLDSLDERTYAIDVAAMVPHGPLRVYVMEERAFDEAATAEDRQAMADLVREAIEAGAVGFSSSRAHVHQASDGRPVPGTEADAAELLQIGQAMRQAGSGVFEVIPSGLAGDTGTGEGIDRWTTIEELDLFRRFVEETGRPVTYLFAQSHMAGEVFERSWDAVQMFLSRGLPVYPQWTGRPTGVLTGLQAYHIFQARPTYRQLARLPLDVRVAEMRRPDTKAQILREADVPSTATGLTENFERFIARLLSQTYLLSEPLDYEPDPLTSVAERARVAGRDPLDVLYDLLLESDGRALLSALATNYLAGDLRLTEEIIREDGAILGSGDAGAHVRFICDGSIPTSTLMHWTRDRSRGARLPVELIVKRLSRDTAALFGMSDRGTIEVGKRADLNVIDWSRLRLELPELVSDLPTGSSRFIQPAHGYVLTTVGGVPTIRNDHDIGSRPGRLVRAPSVG